MMHFFWRRRPFDPFYCHVKGVWHGPPRGYSVVCMEKHTDQKNEVLTTTESDNSTLVLLAVISLLGMVALTLSIAKEQREKIDKKAYLEEE